MRTFFLLVTGLLVISTGCVMKKSGLVETEEPPAASAMGSAQTGAATPAADVYQSGTASWYGEDFHGRRTANGEVYDMHTLTAAHPSLPFHTLVRVTNRRNRRSVIVRINDRGPFVAGRIIDLSYRAAQEIDMVATGTTDVELRLLNLTEQDPGAVQASRSVADGFILQVGAFRRMDLALERLRQVKSLIREVDFWIHRDSGMHKIQSESVSNRAAVERIRHRLSFHGINSFIRATRR